MVILYRFCILRLSFYVFVWSCICLKSGGFQFLYDSELKTKKNCFVKPGVLTCQNETYNSPPSSVLIADIIFERNCTSCLCPYNTNSTCKEFSLQGSWKNYDYYETFSGKDQGDVPRKRLPCTEKVSTFTNLVKLNYICLENNKILQFCDTSVTKSDSIVYLKYQHQNKIISSSRNCHCKAQTTFGSLEIYALDVRLQHFESNSSGNCNSNQKPFLRMSDDTSNKTIECMNKEILGNLKNIFNSSGQHVDMLLHLEGDPQMVWIAVKATDGGLVTVSCNTDVLQTTKSSTTATTATTVKLTTTTETSSSSRIHKNGTASAFSLDMTTQSVLKSTTATPSTLTDFMYSSLATKVENLTDETITKTTNKPINQHTTHFIVYSSSKNKSKTDPAVIVLAVTGILTLVLILTGIYLGKKRCQSKRLQKQSKHYNNLKLDDIEHRGNEDAGSKRYSSIPRGFDLQQDKTTMDGSNNFDHTEKQNRISGDSIKVYDTANHTSTESTDDFDTYNTTSHTLYPSLQRSAGSNIYDKANFTPNSTVEKGQYDEVRITKDDQKSSANKSEISSAEQCSPTNERLSHSDDDDELNPYTDEVVVRGMTSQRQYMHRWSSTSLFEKDYDETMNDLVKHASDWADSGKFNDNSYLPSS